MLTFGTLIFQTLQRHIHANAFSASSQELLTFGGNEFWVSSKNRPKAQLLRARGCLHWRRLSNGAFGGLGGKPGFCPSLRAKTNADELFEEIPADDKSSQCRDWC